MMPIVFCASFLPCPSEKAAAETSWTLRKTRSTLSGRQLRKTQATPRAKKTKPRTRPMSGERTMKSARQPRPEKTRLPTPAFANAAPAKPPMSACEEEDGRPHHQVRRFQTIAPTRPARITSGSTIVGSTIPLPIVLATCVSKAKAATKLKKAAQTTATCGERTRVETTVAMEFAASWKPLMKSKTSATTMMKTT